MRETVFNNLFLPEVRQMLAEDDKAGLQEFCAVLHPAGVASVLEDLEPPDVWAVLKQTALERQVEIFDYFPLHLQEELVEDLDRQSLSRLIEEMAPDDRVDLLERLPQHQVESLMPLIAQAERSDIRRLLSYPDDSAGSIMTTEYALLPSDITANEAIDRLRNQAPDRETIYYVYIVDSQRRLNGFVSLRDLILARPDAVIDSFMRREPVFVRVSDDQEHVAQMLGRYDFIAIPVVDENDGLVGIVTHDDVLDVVQEEATEDALRQGAVEPLEDSYLVTPLHTIAWKRGVWLMFLAFVALLTAAVLRRYESLNAIDSFAFMVAFLPLVLASGGNAGAQSATLVIRTLALEQLDRREAMQMTRRELIIGLALGVAVGIVAWLSAVFGGFGLDARSATVVALTVVTVVILGTVSGSILPLIFRRLGMDPALMSNPLIAAIVDVLGVVIYYEVALALLHRA